MPYDDPRHHHPNHPAPVIDRARSWGQSISITLALVTVLAGTALGISACREPYSTREPAPTITDPAKITNAVSRLCYAVGAYTVDDLNRSAVEGDIDYLAGLQGVPSDLRAAATGYWADPRVRNLDNPGNRAVADRRRGDIIAACKTKGWTAGVKASDQPPLK